MLRINNVGPMFKTRDLETLLVPPIIIRINKFNEEAVEKFTTEMGKAHSTGQDIIPVVIDSYGGEVYSLMAMINEIASATLPVATIVEGKAMSCGAILLGMGTIGHRYVSPNSTVMVHEISSCACGKNVEIQADAKETKRLNDYVYEKLAEHCKRDKKDYFLKMIHKKGHADWYLTANNAKKHGLADHVGAPKMKVSLETKVEIGI